MYMQFTPDLELFVAVFFLLAFANHCYQNSNKHALGTYSNT